MQLQAVRSPSSAACKRSKALRIKYITIKEDERVPLSFWIKQPQVVIKPIDWAENIALRAAQLEDVHAEMLKGIRNGY